MEWVSVKDRLPKDNEKVLVFDTNEKICVGYIFFNHWSHHPIGSFAGDGCLFNVTHWMPLPYSPESNDKNCEKEIHIRYGNLFDNFNEWKCDNCGSIFSKS